jgi:hypothetical protein
MNSQEFVDVISKVVLDSTVDGIQKQLERPAGRNPAKEINEMSAWYNNLEESNKQMVHKIIRKSVRDGVFGFLCVLDGARAIESTDKGTLKLYYERRDEKVLLNDQAKFGLHEML